RCPLGGPPRRWRQADGASHFLWNAGARDAARAGAARRLHDHRACVRSRLPAGRLVSAVAADALHRRGRAAKPPRALSAAPGLSFAMSAAPLTFQAQLEWARSQDAADPL